jgi:hypothetical protein
LRYKNCAFIGHPEFGLDSLPLRKMRELVIGYGPDHFPIAAVCYACGASMPKPDPALTQAEDVIAWYESVFAAHKERKHGGMINGQKLDGPDPLKNR